MPRVGEFGLSNLAVWIQSVTTEKKTEKKWKKYQKNMKYEKKSQNAAKKGVQGWVKGVCKALTATPRLPHTITGRSGGV